MQYEYMTETPKMKKGLTGRSIDKEATEAMLNSHGAHGWELVAVVPISGNTGVSWGGTTASIIYHFKRAIA